MRFTIIIFYFTCPNHDFHDETINTIVCLIEWLKFAPDRNFLAQSVLCDTLGG